MRDSVGVVDTGWVGGMMVVIGGIVRMISFGMEEEEEK